MRTSVRFNVFRYQILPIAQVQFTLFEKPISRDELVSRKNEFFLQALREVEEFKHAYGEITHQILAEEDDVIVMRFGVNRSLKRERKDFTEEVLDNWPNSIVVINNKPNVQKIAIEIEPKAFQHVETVITIIQETLNEHLEKYHLHTSFNPLFDKSEFWEVVRNHPQTITEAEFRMVSPNMSNISGDLKVDLAGWNRTTNTQETTIQLRSDANSHLTFAPGEEPVDSLVDYSSQGGGNIKLKIRGYSRKISTDDRVSEIAVEEIDVTLSTIEEAREVAKIFQKFLTP